MHHVKSDGFGMEFNAILVEMQQPTTLLHQTDWSWLPIWSCTLILWLSIEISNFIFIICLPHWREGSTKFYSILMVIHPRWTTLSKLHIIGSNNYCGVPSERLYSDAMVVLAGDWHQQFTCTMLEQNLIAQKHHNKLHHCLHCVLLLWTLSFFEFYSKWSIIIGNWHQHITYKWILQELLKYWMQ